MRARFVALMIVGCGSTAVPTTPPVRPVTAAPQASSLIIEADFQLPIPDPLSPPQLECRSFPMTTRPPARVTVFELAPIPVFSARRGARIVDRPRLGLALTASDVQRLFAAREAYLTSCWKWASARGAVATSLDVELSIDPFGQTHDVRVAGTSPRDDELVACVRDGIAPAQWMFGIHPRALRVAATLAFVAEDQAAWTIRPARPTPPPSVSPTWRGNVCVPVVRDAGVDNVQLPYPLVVSDWDDSRNTTRAPAPVRVGCSTMARETNKHAIRVALASNMGGLETCYVEAIQRTPDLSGDVVVKTSFDWTGQASGTRTTGAGDPALHACISAAIDALWIDPPDRGIVVSFTFALTPLPVRPLTDDPVVLLDAGETERALAAWVRKLATPHTRLEACRARSGIVRAMARAAPWLDDERLRAAVRELVQFALTLPAAEARTCIAEADAELRAYVQLEDDDRPGWRVRSRGIGERYEAVLPLAPLLSWGAVLRWHHAEALLLTDRRAEGRTQLASLVADPVIGNVIADRIKQLDAPHRIGAMCSP